MGAGMKMMFVATVFFMVFQSPVQAENWSALGILTTHNKDLGYFKTESIKIDGFKSREDCEKTVKFESGSSDYVGVGGTNKRVPGIHWNFDADCLKINDE